MKDGSEYFGLILIIFFIGTLLLAIGLDAPIGLIIIIIVVLFMYIFLTIWEFLK